jgi:hypothetical protein
MISSHDEYLRATAELAYLEDWLRQLHGESGPNIGISRAGVRKPIARLHEELGVYDGTQEHFARMSK